MSKIVTNTTGSVITLNTVGVSIIAGVSYTLATTEYLQWATAATIAEITPYLISGDLVVNDGLDDLDADNGARYLAYPDDAYNVRFLSDPDRTNGFTAKNVQEAIEEAKTGVVPVAATTTIGAVTAIAYSATLDDDSSYEFDARVIARRTDADGDHADFQQVVTVERSSGGAAAINGKIFQKRANRTDSDLDVCWIVSGNTVQLEVTGAAGKTIKWQPQIEFKKVSN